MGSAPDDLKAVAPSMKRCKDTSCDGGDWAGYRLAGQIFTSGFLSFPAVSPSSYLFIYFSFGPGGRV